jgi:hypothetical protein
VDDQLEDLVERMQAMLKTEPHRLEEKHLNPTRFWVEWSDRLAAIRKLQNEATGKLEEVLKRPDLLQRVDTAERVSTVERLLESLRKGKVSLCRQSEAKPQPYEDGDEVSGEALVQRVLANMRSPDEERRKVLANMRSPGMTSDRGDLSARETPAATPQVTSKTPGALSDQASNSNQGNSEPIQLESPASTACQEITRSSAGRWEAEVAEVGRGARIPKLPLEKMAELRPEEDYRLRPDDEYTRPPPLDQVTVSPSMSESVIFARTPGNGFKATLDTYPRSPSQPEVTTPSDNGRNAATPWTAGQRGARHDDDGRRDERTEPFGGVLRSLDFGAGPRDFEDSTPQGQVFYVPRSKSTARLNGDDLRWDATELPARADHVATAQGTTAVSFVSDCDLVRVYGPFARTGCAVELRGLHADAPCLGTNGELLLCASSSRILLWDLPRLVVALSKRHTWFPSQEVPPRDPAAEHDGVALTWNELENLARHDEVKCARSLSAQPIPPTAAIVGGEHAMVATPETVWIWSVPRGCEIPPHLAHVVAVPGARALAAMPAGGFWALGERVLSVVTTGVQFPNREESAPLGRLMFKEDAYQNAAQFMLPARIFTCMVRSSAEPNRAYIATSNDVYALDVGRAAGAAQLSDPYTTQETILALAVGSHAHGRQEALLCATSSGKVLMWLAHAGPLRAAPDRAFTSKVPHVIYTKSDGFESQPFLEKAVMEYDAPARVVRVVGAQARASGPPALVKLDVPLKLEVL